MENDLNNSGPSSSPVNEPNPVPSPEMAVPSPPPPKRKSFFWTFMKIIGGFFLIFFLLGASFIAVYFNEAKEAWGMMRSEVDKYQKLKDEHNAVKKTIENIDRFGTPLPPCPLIFPLLDEKGQVTPLGSYLSVFAMERATYLPKAVYQMATEITYFNCFRLFDKQTIYHQNYKEQLPLLFETQNFAEGTMIQKKKNYQIHLRFYGRQAEKTYDRVFTKGTLYLAPDWMAKCLHEWMGFKANKAQSDYLNNPVYKTDEHLKKAATTLSLDMQGGDVLLTRWNEIAADDPDCPCLFPTWVGILEAKDGQSHLDQIKAMALHNPEATCINCSLMTHYYYAGKYDDALKILFNFLKTDDNNEDWYNWAAYALEYKGDWDESIQLVKSWTRRYPSNAVAWDMLSRSMRFWGNTSNYDLRKYPAWAKVCKDRQKEGLVDALKASDLNPRDARVWQELMNYGVLKLIDPDKMDSYFKNAINLNPNDPTTYQLYMTYLRSFESKKHDLSRGFAKTYADQMPALMTDVICTDFTLPCENGESAQRKRLQQMGLNFRKSSEWKNLTAYMKKYLWRNPGDVGEWKVYLQWAVIVDDVDSVFALAKKISKADPELRALYPQVLLFYPTEALKECVTDQDRVALWMNPTLVKHMGYAYRELAKLDPQDWHNLNLLAKYDAQNGKKAEARKILKRIGTHWASEVWDMDEFEREKKQVGLKS